MEGGFGAVSWLRWKSTLVVGAAAAGLQQVDTRRIEGSLLTTVPAGMTLAEAYWTVG